MEWMEPLVCDFSCPQEPIIFLYCLFPFVFLQTQRTYLQPSQSSTNRSIRLTRWISAFIAAWFSLQILQSKESDAYIDRVPPNTYSADGLALKSVRFAGRTMDLTLFALTRAVDVMVGELWSQRKARRAAAQKWTRVRDSFLPYIATLIICRSRHVYQA